MAIKALIEKVNWKQVIGIAAAVATGVAATVNAIGDQRKANEFEALKKTVEDLTKEN